MPLKHHCKIRQRMFIHWKSLFAFGLIFWFLLCAFDFFGGNQHGYVYDTRDYDVLYETFYMDKLKHGTSESTNFIPKLQNFGWSLLVWNSVTFLCSVLFCNVLKMFWYLFAKSFADSNSKTYILANLVSGYPIKTNASKIPIKSVRSKLIKPVTLPIKQSDTQIKLTGESSCPNFLERTNTNLSADTVIGGKCLNTIYRNRVFTPIKDDSNIKLDSYGDNHQLAKLRTEIIRIQNTALKDQAELSRKINATNKEKKELTKQLGIAQKENRAAKQQIEELAQDKVILLKKLETLNKEIKANTKSKKNALAKLEELSNNSDNLKQQLEQVTRDKDILESKLKVLHEEYGRLQERIILTEDHHRQNYQENKPERDINTQMDKTTEELKLNLDNQPNVSQGDLDMKKIQVKIKQLERNLENFNAVKTDINFCVAEQGESEVSLTMDSKIKSEEDIDAYDFYFTNSPRFRYWSGRAGDVRNNPYMRLHNQQGAIRMFAKTTKNSEFSEDVKNSPLTEQDEYSSQESLDSENPSNMVSNSMAFKNFVLKNLQSNSARSLDDYHSDICF